MLHIFMFDYAYRILSMRMMWLKQPKNIGSMRPATQVSQPKCYKFPVGGPLCGWWVDRWMKGINIQVIDWSFLQLWIEGMTSLHPRFTILVAGCCRGLHQLFHTHWMPKKKSTEIPFWLSFTEHVDCWLGLSHTIIYYHTIYWGLTPNIFQDQPEVTPYSKTSWVILNLVPMAQMERTFSIFPEWRWVSNMTLSILYGGKTY